MLEAINKQYHGRKVKVDQGRGDTWTGTFIRLTYGGLVEVKWNTSLVMAVQPGMISFVTVPNEDSVCLACQSVGKLEQVNNEYACTSCRTVLDIYVKCELLKNAIWQLEQFPESEGNTHRFWIEGTVDKSSVLLVDTIFPFTSSTLYEVLDEVTGVIVYSALHGFNDYEFAAYIQVEDEEEVPDMTSIFSYPL